MSKIEVHPFQVLAGRELIGVSETLDKKGKVKNRVPIWRQLPPAAKKDRFADREPRDAQHKLGKAEEKRARRRLRNVQNHTGIRPE